MRGGYEVNENEGVCKKERRNAQSPWICVRRNCFSSCESSEVSDRPKGTQEATYVELLV